MASSQSPPVYRLLVVDDDRSSSLVVCRRLTRLGYDVISANSGEQALAHAVDLAPDLMLLDISMPEMDGLDVLERVRAQGLDLAVIMMTAFGSEDVAIQAMRRGADDYLRKPVQAAELQPVLARTIRRLELSRQNDFLRRELDEKRLRLEAELARASEVQAQLLPRRAPSLPGFEVAAICQPAREVGGDYYDWQTKSDGTLNLTLGDVMGKGLPAALLMATVRAALRVVGELPVSQAVEAVNRSLTLDLQQSDSFITLFHANLEATSGHLTYVDAGHGLSFIQRRDGRVRRLRQRALPLGIFPDAAYPAGTITIDPGDTLVLYSDGVPDARPELRLDADGVAERLGNLTGPQTKLNALLDLLPDSDTRPDDLTLMVVQRLEEPVPAPGKLGPVGPPFR